MEGQITIESWFAACVVFREFILSPLFGVFEFGFRASLIVLLLVSSPVFADDQVSKELLCTSIMPPLLEFTGSVSSAMDTFTKMQQSQLPKDVATQFADVEAKGRELKAASEQYRKLFILACYGG